MNNVIMILAEALKAVGVHVCASNETHHEEKRDVWRPRTCWICTYCKRLAVGA